MHPTRAIFHGLSLSFVLFAAAACGSSEPSNGPPNDSGVDAETPPADRHVVVLFTSDEHSQLFAFSPELDDFPTATTAGSGALVGGITRRATILKRERKAAADAGKDSITLSAGDNVMGTLAHVAFETKSIDFGVLAALGYQATTLGNHELDFGPAALVRSIGAAKSGAGLPTIVASNIHFSDASAADDELAAMWSASPTSATPMHAYTVITTASGVRIGVLGWVGVDAEHVAPNKTPVKFSSNGLPADQEGKPDAVLPRIYADLQPIVDALRTVEKVDLVVGLSHAGVGDSSSEAKIHASEDWQIASNVTGIDLMISGHTHNPDPRPIVATNAKGTTLVLNASELGRHVGRVELTVHADGSPPSWDAATQTLLAVDDTIVPDQATGEALLPLVQSIDVAGTGGRSFLESVLGRATGVQVNDDPSTPGDLYFHSIGRTVFDVTKVDLVLALSSDAMLAAGDAWGASSGKKTDVAIESAGVVRSGLKVGKTGVISAADAFDVVPLGSSPVDGSIGYPLVRAYLWQVELRGVFEATLELGADEKSDFHLGASGIKVEWDNTRPAALSLADLLDPSKGRVVRMSLDTDHADGVDQFDEVIFDRAASIADDFKLYAVVSSSYVGQFATDVGAALKDDKGDAVTLAGSILHRTDASEIKQVESFFGWIHAAPGGTLPALYDASSATAAKRLVCIQGC